MIRELSRSEQRLCGHFRAGFAVLICNGGAEQIRQTCLDCGRRVGPPAARAEHPHADEYPRIEPFDGERPAASRRWVSYEAYLASPEWAERRAYYYAKALYRCELCNWQAPQGSGGRGLNVHHRTYERLGCEFDADVIVLCRSCHERFHDIAKAA